MKWLPKNFQNEELDRLLAGASVVSHSKTRLNGEILKLDSDKFGTAFVKIGRGHERTEILREHRVLEYVGPWDIAPKTIYFQDSTPDALHIVTGLSGSPMHETIKTSNREECISVLKSLFDRLWAIKGEWLDAFPVAAEEELSDVKNLLLESRIDESRFRAQVKEDPSELFEKISKQIAGHHHKYLSHGDLCLPNIIVCPDKKARLIDWGKSGRGDRVRDLAALQASISRNLDGAFFDEFAKSLPFKIDDGDKGLSYYRLLDFYWYSAIQPT